MKNINMYCYDYVLDLFKGFCEINNYNHIKSKMYDNKLKKVYYEDSNSKFVIENKNNKNEYLIAELINIGVKFLDTLKLNDIQVKIIYDKNDEALIKETIETVYSLDLECTILEKQTTVNEISYSIGINGYENIIIGYSNKLEIDYELLENVLEKKDLIPKKDDMEIYVVSKEKAVQSDTFIIGTLLRNSGFKTEIDYTDSSFEEKLKTAKELNVSYVIIVDKESIKNYSVKLFDVAFKKEKTVNIDNLFQELYMGEYEEDLK